MPGRARARKASQALRATDAENLVWRWDVVAAALESAAALSAGPGHRRRAAAGGGRMSRGTRFRNPCLRMPQWTLHKPTVAVADQEVEVASAFAEVHKQAAACWPRAAEAGTPGSGVRQ